MPHYSVIVKDTITLSKNMRRIVFSDNHLFLDNHLFSNNLLFSNNSLPTSNRLATFPETSAASYVKLIFDQQGNAIEFQAPDAPRPRMRTYTIKSIDRQAEEITLDFALHSHNDLNETQTNDGLASRWAEYAKVGDKISFAGPGSSKSLADKYDWVLFAGDITALPSIENYLANLPKNTKGFAFIQVPENEDIRSINKPENLQIVWMNYSESLAQRIAKTELIPGIPAIWAACEFSQMRALRQLFTKDMGISRNQIYISSYWKKGRSEEQHKADKRDDIEQEQNIVQKQEQLLKAG